MKHQGFLRAYQMCLRLYPHKFRQRYAEQMQLTAQDMLQDARTGWETTRVIGSLAGDAGIGLLTEHTKQLGGIDMNKQSKLTTASVSAAALLGVQIVAVPVLAFLCIASAVNFWRDHNFPISIYRVSDLVVCLMPMIMTALTFRLLGKLELGLWSRVVRSLVIGCITGLSVYIVGGYLMLRAWETWDVLQEPFGFLFEWAAIALCIAAFYVTVTRVVGLAAGSTQRSKPKLG